ATARSSARASPRTARTPTTTSTRRSHGSSFRSIGTSASVRTAASSSGRATTRLPGSTTWTSATRRSGWSWRSTMRTETFGRQQGAVRDGRSRTGLTTVTTEVTMTTRMASVAIAALLMGVPAWAQDPKVEISGNAGWTFSDGVSSDTAILAGDGNLYNRVDPK